VKFREIFLFEFEYQAHRVRTWLYFAVLFVAAYGLRDGVVNSPFAIAQETILTGMLWILMAPAVAGAAAARDVETRMYLLVYTTPISKADYLGGRFLAAFVLNALILLAVPLGMLAAMLFGSQPENAGPFRPAVYLSSYGVIALPTAFTFTAIQFSLAALKRRAVVSYLATVLFVVAVGAVVAVTVNVLQMPTLGKLLDPTVRMNVLVLMADTFTPLQMNTVVIGLERSILANRILWVGVSFAMLAFTYSRLRLDHRAG
jgi:ABC-type transport system involved in multi-copper enzyme maturation permease subunit